MTDFSAARVFAKHDVANPVQAVFDAPVTDPRRQELSCAGAFGREAGDRVLHLHGLVTLADGGAFEAQNLRETRPAKSFR